MSNKNLQNLDKAKLFLNSNPTTIELLNVILPINKIDDIGFRDAVAEVFALNGKNLFVLEKLSNSGLLNENILTSLATNPNISEIIFKNLLNSKSLKVYEALAENISLNEKQMETLFNLDIDSVDYILASNPNLKEYVISYILEEYIINNEDLSMAIALATNPSISEEAYDYLSDTKEIKILEALLLNPSLTDFQKDEIKIDIKDLKINEMSEIQHFENMRNGLA